MIRSIRSSKWLLVLLGALAVMTLRPLYAWAQQQVQMTGTDSSGNVTIIRTDSTGNLITNSSAGAASTHAACVNTDMTIGTTGTACPPTPMAARSSVLIQLVQAGETLTVTEDGSAATSTHGVAVGSGGDFHDNLSGAVSTSCRCTAASCHLNVLECP